MNSTTTLHRRLIAALVAIGATITIQAKDVTLSGATTSGTNHDIQVTYALNGTDKIARVKKVTDKLGSKGNSTCVIPSSIKVDGVKYTVTKIGAKAFSYCTETSQGTEVHIYHGFKKIVLPSTIVEIGAEAFYYCEFLTTCELPNKIQTIGADAFHGSHIKSVNIPGTCTTIGEGAFRCSYLTTATFADSSTPLTIKKDAFRGSGLTKVVLPARLTAMGDNVFALCNYLKEVVINSNLATLPKETFYTFHSSELRSVQINGPIQTIGDRAFYGNNMLATIIFPSTLRTIGESAFEGCFWNGTTFNGVLPPPAGLQTIGASAFKECGLTGINIPGTVTSIGSGAFVGSKLWTVRCDAIIPPDTPTYLLFDLDTYLNADLNIPATSWQKYKTALGWSMFNYDKYSGVEDILPDDDDIEAVYYTLQGVRVERDNMSPGVYIERRGTKTRKVTIR